MSKEFISLCNHSSKYRIIYRQLDSKAYISNSHLQPNNWYAVVKNAFCHDHGYSAISQTGVTELLDINWLL